MLEGQFYRKSDIFSLPGKKTYYSCPFKEDCSLASLLAKSHLICSPAELIYLYANTSKCLWKALSGNTPACSMGTSSMQLSASDSASMMLSYCRIVLGRVINMSRTHHFAVVVAFRYTRLLASVSTFYLITLFNTVSKERHKAALNFHITD